MPDFTTSQPIQKTAKWRMVSIVSTSGWRDDLLVKAGGAIAETYLYDENRVTHCCEITPSYEMYRVDTLPWSPDESGDLESELRSGYDSDVIYMHTKVVDGMAPEQRYVLPDQLLVA
ncbi:MAG: hypothetical protein ACP5RC_10440, partial [Halothiobacillaceae bacterium]